jgi:hypothetical protein
MDPVDLPATVKAFLRNWLRRRSEHRAPQG